MIESINPATGERIATYRVHTAAEVDAMARVAKRAQGEWRTRSFEARGEVLRRAAAELRRSADDLARRMALEMGKPIAGGRAEVEKCAWVCEYYAEHAASFLANQPIETDAAHSYISFQPLGVVLAVMPWNFPLWQVFRAAAPTLMAGNGMLLKHASNVSGCALDIEAVLLRAGLPEGLLRVALGGREMVARLIEHREVAAVTLTGSTRAGRSVASTAGAALKKCVLELGGSDAYVVLEDADVELAARVCAKARLINGGQSCIAAKRFIVARRVREAFEARMVEHLQRVRIGDPLDERTELGPMARVDLRDELAGQVRASLQLGARCRAGGEIPEGPGAWYRPTVLTNVVPGMPAFDEETFGPVAAIVEAEDDAAALRLANQSVFGLGGAIFTRDAERGQRLAERELEAGACFVNDQVRSDPRLPFGGIKDSGFGRELSAFGIREFTNVKTVYVGKS